MSFARPAFSACPSLAMWREAGFTRCFACMEPLMMTVAVCLTSWTQLHFAQHLALVLVCHMVLSTTYYTHAHLHAINNRWFSDL